jgi:electron transfer flavoprotein alpha subunit
MRRRVVLAGSVAEQAAELARRLREQGLLDGDPDRPNRERSERVPDTSGRDVGRRVAVYLEPDRPDANRELLGRAAAVAADVDGRVVALTWRSGDGATLASWGADDLVGLSGSDIEQDVAAALAAWCADTRPWAFLLSGTASGREIAGRVAAELGLGLTGDAIDISANGEVLVAWKPAFGGQLVAAITTRSDVQMATVRPGVLPIGMPRSHHAANAAASIDIAPTAPTRRIEVVRDDKLGLLSGAERVIAVGAAVPPETYPELEELRRLLNAELGGTRKVTDKGWLPRARQIGITGQSISPHLFLSIGASGKFNHIIGACGAHLLVAINNDPDALIFGAADIGIVGDWREVVPLLVSALEMEMARAHAELR